MHFLASLIFSCFLLVGLPVFAQSEADSPAETFIGSSTPAEKAQALLAELAEVEARLKELEADLSDKTGASRQLQIRQIQAEELRGGNIAHDLAELVIASPEDSDDLGSARADLIRLMESWPDGIQRALDERQALLEERRTERDQATPEAAVDLQDGVATAARALDDVYVFYTRHIKLMDKLGVDSTEARESLVKQLENRADRLVTVTRVSSEEALVLQERLSQDPGDATANVRQKVVSARLRSATEGLRLIVDQLQQLNIDTVEYQKQLVRVTGDVSAIGLDSEVVTGLFIEGVASFREWLRRDAVSFLVRAALLVVTLIAAWILARIVGAMVGRLLGARRAGMSRLLRSMLVGLVSNLVLIIGVLVALSQLGISVGQLLAGVGIAGFIVGFALQDTLSNFASGVMILINRPFDEGDVVEAAGVNGTVQTMSLVSTVILTFDNQTLIVPNNKIWGDVIRNVTHQKTRRVDLVVRVGHGDDLDAAEALLLEIVMNDQRVLAEPEPNIRLHELADSSFDFIVRPWVKTEDYWGVYWDLTREIQRRLAAEGFKTPRPQRDIYYHGEVVAASDVIEKP
ncbi:MAG: mechanosensitive ion channel domain-containing protein [Gammaproteobacteria bacterium]